MENQHRSIKGYRELSSDEIDLMNDVKLYAELGRELLERVGSHLEQQRRLAAAVPPPEGPAELTRIKGAEPERWRSIGRTHLQEGCMAIARAVAQPTTF